MKNEDESNVVRGSFINGPVQLAGQQVNNFIGGPPQPSAHDLLRDRKHLSRAAYWQLRRGFLLWFWNAFLCLGFVGTLVVVGALRGGGLIGDLLRGHLHWLVAVTVVGWVGDALFFWARHRLEARRNPLLTRGGPVFLYDVLPRLLAVAVGAALFAGLPRLAS
ncbi:hypothetical protein [Streptomyces sp. NPDC058374]|uniref:hypothetical protein n=1 Tax=Streptomyces sp. NPDC058374 TaxID=3346466 RepID=UPI0036512CE4